MKKSLESSQKAEKAFFLLPRQFNGNATKQNFQEKESEKLVANKWIKESTRNDENDKEIEPFVGL